MHCHLTSIQVDTESLGCIHQFLKCSNIVLAHQTAEYLRSGTEEIKLTRRRHLQSAHHKSEDFRKP